MIKHKNYQTDLFIKIYFGIEVFIIENERRYLSDQPLKPYRPNQLWESTRGRSTPVCFHGTRWIIQTHYLFQILRFIKNDTDRSERLNDLAKRLFLYGFSCMFSLNFLQSSVMTSIMSWVTLVCLIMMHCFIFLKETGQKYHNNGLLVFYGLLMVWYISIVFFYIYNAFNGGSP